MDLDGATEGEIEKNNYYNSRSSHKQILVFVAKSLAQTKILKFTNHRFYFLVRKKRG